MTVAGTVTAVMGMSAMMAMPVAVVVSFMVVMMRVSAPVSGVGR